MGQVRLYGLSGRPCRAMFSAHSSSAASATMSGVRGEGLSPSDLERFRIGECTVGCPSSPLVRARVPLNVPIHLSPLFAWMAVEYVMRVRELGNVEAEAKMKQMEEEGHDISTCIENLRPTCASCNGDMRTFNLFSFIDVVGGFMKAEMEKWTRWFRSL